MEFKSARKVKPKHTNIVSLELLDLYPHCMQMYKIPPVDDIQLTELEQMAAERVQLLRIVEQASMKGHKAFSKEWKDCIQADVAKAGFKLYSRLLRDTGTGSNLTDADLQARRLDHISHFILRLAYCRSEDLRKWFIARELELFRLRFSEMSPEGVHSFLTINNFDYQPIGAEEKENFRSELINSTYNLYDSNFDKTNIYKVDFLEVLPLVRTRKCFLSAGYAYIPSSELITCIITKFKVHLSEELAKTYRALPLLNDERINDLLPQLHTCYTGKSYAHTGDKEAIDIEDLDVLSRESYPLCMRVIHEQLKANGHLKHFSRLQYGLYIKGIGVRYEDALTFWRESFSKKFDSEQFEKKYAYNFKHQYGKVGGMVNYTPYGCLKIINSSVGQGDNHGCPFKHWDSQSLKQKFASYGFATEAIDEIVELCTKGHYQIACGKYFEYAHKQPSNNVISHPNQYFEESVAIRRGKSSKSGAIASGSK